MSFIILSKTRELPHPYDQIRSLRYQHGIWQALDQQGTLLLQLPPESIDLLLTQNFITYRLDPDGQFVEYTVEHPPLRLKIT